MNQYTLYYFPTCPFCQYVLASLRSLPIDVDKRNIMADANFRNELLAGGGKTQVPCLRIEKDGEVEWMYESQDIIDYLRHEVARAAV